MVRRLLTRRIATWDVQEISRSFKELFTSYILIFCIAKPVGVPIGFLFIPPLLLQPSRFQLHTQLIYLANGNTKAVYGGLTLLYRMELLNMVVFQPDLVKFLLARYSHT
jgi:hypothetical protein